MGEFAVTAAIPRLKATSGGCQFLVNDEPFLILGAELQNSSFSCVEYMLEVWPKLLAQNVNTVLANVAWEDIEPREGQFNFTGLDANILNARQHGLHLIILWFGAFKNGKSTYAPGWVKTDPVRFPRMMTRTARNLPIVTEALSIFDQSVVNADSTAFKTLMQHIKEVDEHFCTILMVQVQNEVGLLGAARDVSPQAEAALLSPVPHQLKTMLRDHWHTLHESLRQTLEDFGQYKNRSDADSHAWLETFGDSLATDELFMAFHFAEYVEKVARAGKKIYPLPMFTNVWQNYAGEDADKSQPVVVGGGGQPGDYPSGGGVINVLDIWQSFAPSLDFIAPDLYLNDYNAVCAKYKHRGQPLFIPEQRRDEYGARRIWSAYGTYQALCTSPFGIDTLEVQGSPWTLHYGLLSQVSDYLLAAQAKPGSSFGFFFDDFENDKTNQEPTQCVMGDWQIAVERAFVFGTPGPGFGMIIQLEAARFLLVGEGFQVRFRSTDKRSKFSGILSVVEKVWCNQSKRLKNGRCLNGDETRSGQNVVMPSGCPDSGNFPISITIPARTRIAECTVYSF